MIGKVLQPDLERGFTRVVGVGGIGAGVIFALDGNRTLGRNESRSGRMIGSSDRCKLHIVEHYIATLMGSGRPGSQFQVFAAGNVGADAAGKTVLGEMSAAGIDTGNVRIEPRESTRFSVCFLYPDHSGGNVTASNSAGELLDSKQLRRCQAQLAEAGSKAIALCLPEAPFEARQRFLEIAGATRSFRVASFAAGEMEQVAEADLLSQIDLLALNHEEASALAKAITGRKPGGGLLRACAKFTARNPLMKIVVSAGADGAYAWDQSRWSRHKPLPAEAVSTAGAGDALLAGILCGLSSGLDFAQPESSRGKAPAAASPFHTAMELGMALASFSVTSGDTIHPGASLDALLAFHDERRRAPGDNGVGSRH